MSAMYGANHFRECAGLRRFNGAWHHTHDDVAIELQDYQFLLSSRRAETLLQRLALCRGVIPLFFDFSAFAPIDLEARTIEFLVDGGFVSRGDFILMTMGGAQGEAGKTDMMKILPVA